MRVQKRCSATVTPCLYTYKHCLPRGGAQPEHPRRKSRAFPRRYGTGTDLLRRLRRTVAAEEGGRRVEPRCNFSPKPRGRSELYAYSSLRYGACKLMCKCSRNHFRKLY
jgi:hypothetical protein